MKANTIKEVSSSILSGALQVEEFVAKVMERIKKYNEELKYFISYDREKASRQAREADAELKRIGPRSLLHGAPISVKDIMAVEGYPMTAGSKLFKRVPAKRDADCVSRAKRAGLIVVGTNNLHELASGATNINPHFGNALNPWNKERMTGGSSGGSAGAVATGMAAISLGTDTSGSVRIPAALCGVVGFKPTYGVISTRGVFPLAWTLDHVGILARSAWDAAMLFKEIISPDYAEIVRRPLLTELKRVRIGVPWKLFEGLADKEYISTFNKFIDKLSSLDFEPISVEIPWFNKLEVVWRVIRRSEPAAIHRKWVEEAPHLIGEDVLALLKDGMRYSAVEYITALREREKLTHKFEVFMEGLDALVLPTLTFQAPPLNVTEINIGGKTVNVYMALLSLTYQFNVLGGPAVSIPIGFGSSGLPYAAQVVGARLTDVKVLSIAYAYEENVGGFKFPEPLI